MKSARRMLGGSLPLRLLDTTSTLPVNTSVDMAIPSVAANMPIVVVTMRAASTTSSTSDGTLTVARINSDTTTTGLSDFAVIAGPSGSNFHGDVWMIRATAGMLGIRITSSGADATTTIAYRAVAWSKPVATSLTTGGGSINGASGTHNEGPFTNPATSPVFMMASSWSGASASKTVNWNSGGAVTMPGTPWLSHTFTVGGTSHPINCSVDLGGTSKSYSATASGSDWFDFSVTTLTNDWGLTAL